MVIVWHICYFISLTFFRIVAMLVPDTTLALFLLSDSVVIRLEIMMK